MERVVGGLVERTIARNWRGAPHPFERAREWTVTILPGETIPNSPGGGWVAKGDFRITHALLARKGLL